MSDRQLTALIVEDDADLSLLLASCVQGCGFQTVTAATKQAALARVDQADLLLMDLLMPNGENTALLSAWVRRHGTDSCIIISGHVNDKLKDDLVLAGATYVQDKPIKLHVLLILLRRMERWNRWKHELDTLKEEVRHLRAIIEGHAS